MKKVPIPTKYQRQIDAKLDALIPLIRKKRLARGLTQETLADALDISVEMIRSIEGRVRNPSLQVLLYICLFLDIEVTFK